MITSRTGTAQTVMFYRHQNDEDSPPPGGAFRNAVKTQRAPEVWGIGHDNDDFEERNFIR
jgi:hypothetical protein